MPVITLTQVLFIVYCLEVGFFLVFAPWSTSWDRVVLHQPLAQSVPWLLHPAFRGGISGFGLVHVVWGAHDLEQMLSRRRAARRANSPHPDDVA